MEDVPALQGCSDGLAIAAFGEACVGAEEAEEAGQQEGQEGAGR